MLQRNMASGESRYPRSQNRDLGHPSLVREEMVAELRDRMQVVDVCFGRFPNSEVNERRLLLDKDLFDACCRSGGKNRLVVDVPFSKFCGLWHLLAIQLSQRMAERHKILDVQHFHAARIFLEYLERRTAAEICPAAVEFDLHQGWICPRHQYVVSRSAIAPLVELHVVVMVGELEPGALDLGC